MSDNGRRFFCRVVFLVACFLPTAAILYFILHKPGPNEWEQLIQSNLPVNVDVASVETPFPGRVVLRGVDLTPADAGTFPELSSFSVNEINLDFHFDHNEISFVHPIEIKIGSLANIVKRLLIELNEDSLKENKWQLNFKKVALIDSTFNGGGMILKPLTISIYQGPSAISDSNTLQLDMLARTCEDDPECQLAAHFEKSPEGNVVSVDSRNSYIPMNLIQEFFAGSTMFGKNSSFSGQIKFDWENNSRVSGTVIGELANVQLDELQFTKDQMTGVCDVKNFYCMVEQGRIQSAQMQVVSSNPIAINNSFLEKSEPFGIKVRPNSYSDRLAISQLELGVTFQNGNVILSGRKGEVTVGDEKVIADCIAFQQQGGSLHTVAICNSQKSIPLITVAKLMTGADINRALRFVDRFSIPARTADQTEFGNDLY